jgi:hypothetical protein
MVRVPVELDLIELYTPGDRVASAEPDTLTLVWFPRTQSGAGSAPGAVQGRGTGRLARGSGTSAAPVVGVGENWPAAACRYLPAIEIVLGGAGDTANPPPLGFVMLAAFESDEFTAMPPPLIVIEPAPVALSVSRLIDSGTMNTRAGGPATPHGYGGGRIGRRLSGRGG